MAGSSLHTWAWLTVMMMGVAVVSPQCLTPNDTAHATPTTTPEDLSAIADFGLDLFREVFPYNDTQRNFFFSPYSVWSSLMLLYVGARGRSEDQLRHALRVGEDKVVALRAWRAVELLYSMRQGNTSHYALRIANRLYFDQSVPVRDCIQDILQDELRTVDFTQAEAAADEINEFVSNTTKGAIPSLLSASQVSRALMAVVNAAYFKGTWQYQFKPSLTEKRLFYATPQDYYFVDMMRQKGNFRHGISEELGCHLLELPYHGDSLAMYLLLPPFIAGENGFNALVSRLNGSLLHAALQDMWRAQVEVLLPKFRIQEEVEDELMEALGRLGVVDVFDRGVANLTGFSEGGGLSVGASVHKAVVEVSEEGTEAAAATALISFRIARPAAPERFECNHPFLFLVYDNAAQNILFMGAYKNPKALA